MDIAPSAPAASSVPGPSAQTGGYAPLEGLEDEDEEMEEDTGMEMTLHGVDGTLINRSTRMEVADDGRYGW